MRWLLASAVLIAFAPSAFAQVTRTYEYDALGRLTKAAPSSGTPVCYAYDVADNRSNVTGGGSCAGGGGGSNSPPTANYDFIFFFHTSGTWSGNLSVLSNDTDPDLPNDTLTVTGVTGSQYASVAPGGTDVYFNGLAGSYSLNYTIKDSHNATSSATVDLTILYCSPVEC